MSMQLTSDEILDKIRRAFAPYHVVAELQDYHRQLGFRVYDNDNEIIDTFEGNLVQDLRNPASLKQMILEARAAVERAALDWNGVQIRLTVSIGVAPRLPDEHAPAAAVERADKALYAAKRAGRNQVCVAPARFI